MRFLTHGILGEHNNSAGLGVFTYNLRFPEQYADAETRLFYNFISFPRSDVGIPIVMLQRHATQERYQMRSHVGTMKRTPTLRSGGLLARIHNTGCSKR